VPIRKMLGVECQIHAPDESGQAEPSDVAIRPFARSELALKPAQRYEGCNEVAGLSVEDENGLSG